MAGFFFTFLNQRLLQCYNLYHGLINECSMKIRLGRYRNLCIGMMHFMSQELGCSPLVLLFYPLLSKEFFFERKIIFFFQFLFYYCCFHLQTNKNWAEFGVFAFSCLTSLFSCIEIMLF